MSKSSLCPELLLQENVFLNCSERQLFLSLKSGNLAHCQHNSGILCERKTRDVTNQPNYGTRLRILNIVAYLLKKSTVIGLIIFSPVECYYSYKIKDNKMNRTYSTRRRMRDAYKNFGLEIWIRKVPRKMVR
jgi:hypothetical protein